MSAIPPAATQAYGEISGTLDERTLEILARRREASRRIRRGWLVRRALVLADLVGLGIAFLAASAIFGDPNGSDAVRPQIEMLVFALTLPAWVVVAKLYGLYDLDEERTDHSTTDDLVPVLHLVTVGSWLFFAITSVTRTADTSLPRLFVFWLFAIIFITAGRVVARTIARRTMSYVQNTIIVGAGDVGQLVAKKLRHHPEYGLNLVGFVDDQPKDRLASLNDLALLGGPEQLPRLVRVLDVERVIVAFSNDSHEEMLDLIRSLKDLDIQIDLVPRFFEVIGTEHRHPCRRGPAADRAAPAAALELIPPRQARDGPRRSPSSASCFWPLSSRSSRLRSSWTRGPGLLPTGPRRSRRPGVRDPQVPDDGRRRRGAEARARHLNKHDRGRPAHVQDPE